ncbi:MAG: SOS response-associated peptidase family protein [Pseudobacteriovorax sp.]|nr:SOS response-associated peptidase family protein [Pseudobacteriovorax sp.]
MCYSVLIEQDLKTLEEDFRSSINVSHFAEYEALQAKDPKKVKDYKSHPRLYPNYWGLIISLDDAGNRQISPMRYRLRPNWSDKEIPSKYNVFNARLDALETRRSWSGLLGQNHGIVLVKQFFEWVQDQRTGKKKVVAFSGTRNKYQFVPVLYDSWQASKEDPILYSFAIITTDPNPEVLKAGHDRTPIGLSREHARQWIDTSQKNKSDFYKILQQPSLEYYAVSDANP